MSRIILFAILGVLCLAGHHVAHAQGTTGNPLVVTTCGTIPPGPYNAGTYAPYTVDTSGRLCGSGASVTGYGCNGAGSTLNNPNCLTVTVSPTPGIAPLTSPNDTLQVLGTTAGTSHGLAAQAGGTATNSASAPGYDTLRSGASDFTTFTAPVPGAPLRSDNIYATDGTSFNTRSGIFGCDVDPLTTISTGKVLTDCYFALMNNSSSTPSLPSQLTNFHGLNLRTDYLKRVFSGEGMLEPVGEVIGTAPVFQPPHTNLLLQSTSLTTGWTTSNATVTPSANTDPVGGTGAFTVTDTSASNTGNINQAITVANDSANYCVMVYANSATSTSASTFDVVATFSGGTGATYGSRFSSVTGEMQGTNSSTLAYSGGMYLSPLFGSADVGWKRLFTRATNNGTGNTTLTISLRPDTAATSGVGATDFYGPEVVKANQCPDAYIPTTSAAVAMPAGVGPAPFVANSANTPSATNLALDVLGLTDTGVKGLYSGGTDILSIGTKGLNAITVNASQGVGMAAAVTAPALASSSSAQTGTLCWTTGTGNFTVDTTTTCLLSDEKDKEDIAPLSFWDGMHVMSWQPLSYRYKEGFRGDNDPNLASEQIGFTAQRMAAVEPRLASVGPDGQPHSVRYQQATAELTVMVQWQAYAIFFLLAWCAGLTVAVIVLARRPA